MQELTPQTVRPCIVRGGHTPAALYLSTMRYTCEPGRGQHSWRRVRQLRAQTKEGAMAFVVFKSYDGGKRWERAREYNDFASAAKASLTLGAQHPCIRFRVEAVRTKRRQR